VCDLRLPDGRGTGVLALAKALDETVRTILISGELDSVDLESVRHEGIADCCLVKGSEVIDRLNMLSNRVDELAGRANLPEQQHPRTEI